LKHLILVIDALGYSSITKQKMPNLINIFQEGYFKSVKTLLGYSNAIIPSIFSGAYPSEHNIWGVYKMSPKTSPFKVSPLIPKSILDRSLIARYIVNRCVFRNARKHGLVPDHGAFLNIPLQLIEFFDLSMKKHIIEPNSMNGTITLFDLMRQKKIPFEYVGYPWNEGTRQILELTEKQIHNTSLVFAYIDEIDHLGHKYGINSKNFLEHLKSFDELLSRFLQRIMKMGEECSITIFSDHGMHDVIGSTDVKSMIDSTGLKIGKDYIPFLDSTIARFWTNNNNAKERLINVLEQTKGGRLLNAEEIIKYKINFKSNIYGDLLYLADVGKIISPSFFTIIGGSVGGMQGWDPEHESQNSFIFTNQKPKVKEIENVSKIFYLLRDILKI
jgi:predicted AlkP superfamily pyrophosphatase or phosphodiesterase